MFVNLEIICNQSSANPYPELHDDRSKGSEYFDLSANDSGLKRDSTENRVIQVAINEVRVILPNSLRF